MDKEKYEPVEIEVIAFDADDVISVSKHTESPDLPETGN